MSAAPVQAIVMGVSAGALEALGAVLPQLPANLPVPVLIVVHLPPDKESILAGLLEKRCAIAVREAGDKEEIQPGVAYIAPADYHLLVEQTGELSLSADDPVLFSRPSIDVLFESAADVYGNGLLAVLLTGASADGARGLRAILDAGGHAIVQDPTTAYAATMPEAAMALCPEATVLPLNEIGSHLHSVCMGVAA